MRRFRVKDLMVQVLPGGGEPGGCQRTYEFDVYNCYGTEDCFHTIDRYQCYRYMTGRCLCISALNTDCGKCSFVSPIPMEKLDLEDLAVAKLQLKQALAELDRYERIVAEMESPQTLEEVEAVEQKLTVALEELKARKEQLRK